MPSSAIEAGSGTGRDRPAATGGFERLPDTENAAEPVVTCSMTC